MTVYRAADLSRWGDKVKRHARQIAQQASQEVFEQAQTPVAQGGNMPVDTGFLRNTFLASLNGGAGLTGPNAYVMAIVGLEIGDVIEGGWTAAYAKHVEYGTRGRPGRLFMNSAANNWQSIVEGVVRRVAGMR